MAFNCKKSLISEDILADMKHELYDYQKETVNNAIDKMLYGDQNIGQIILPTGAGKTKIAEYLTARMINEIFTGYGRTSICGIACHRLILANNLLNRILITLAYKVGLKNFELVVVNSGDYSEFLKEFEDNFGIKLPIVNIKNYTKESLEGYLAAAQNAGKHCFFVMLYHSLDKVIGCDVNFDFVFCDEAHTTIEKQHFYKLEQFVKQSELVFHMTATPTTNNTGNDMTNKDVYGDIIIEKHPRELVFGKHICPINLILHETFKNDGNIKTRNDIFQSTDSVINSIIYAAESLFAKVEQNQINANIPFNERKQGVLFVSVTGNKHLTEMIECHTDSGQKFAAWRENNDVDLYIISSEKSGWIDYAETKRIGDEENLDKETFLKRLHDINKTHHNKSIIVFIDMLSEGVDLPDINGVLLLRQLDDNVVKVLQIIGRSVRRDDADRKLINNNEVKFTDYDKFKKPCAYVYLPTAAYTRHESENIMNIMLKLYDAYGDIVFHMATRENMNGETIKLIDNPGFMTKNDNNNSEKNHSLNREKVREIVINLLSNVEVSYEEKLEYLHQWFANHIDYLKENETCPEYNYAKTVNGDVNLLYDFIKINVGI